MSSRKLAAGTLVGVAGELDITNSGQLAGYLNDRHPDWALPLVLDMAAVTFMDSSGVHLLIDLHHREDASGGSLHLAAPHARVTRVLEIIGTDRLLRTHPSLSTAMAAAHLTLWPTCRG
ncbi:STAS domain-containing protein [Nonomuraea sp. NPDC059194]|uniref:STAS domain-containing protein n=1 Tax=Nonomuraea sp. NPDC059194 TaxID=3346764 RepID=UPI00368694E8